MNDQFAATQRQLAELQSSIAELQRQVTLVATVQSQKIASLLMTPSTTTTTTTTTNDQSNYDDVSGSVTTTQSKSQNACIVEGECSGHRPPRTITDITQPLLPIMIVATIPPAKDDAITADATADAGGSGSGGDSDVGLTHPTASRRVKRTTSTVGSRESSWRVSSLLQRQNATASDECNLPENTATDHVVWRPQSEVASATSSLETRSQTARLPTTVEEQINGDGRFGSETLFTFAL